MEVFFGTSILAQNWPAKTAEIVCFSKNGQYDQKDLVF